MIEDFYFLVATLSCGQDVNPDSFDVLAKDWLRRFHSNNDINWNWLSPTMHLVLEHGADIIRALPFNPGMSSEEAIEHGNKVWCLKCKKSFFLLRFYVKSIFEILEVQNLHVSTHLKALNFDFLLIFALYEGRN